MNIVWLTHRFWPAVGGVEKYVLRTAQAMQRLGHHVQLVTAAHADALPRRDVHEGVPILRYAAHRAPWRAALSMASLRGVFADADVIHISDVSEMEQYYRLLAWQLPDKPVFLTRHGMSYRVPVPADERRRAERSLAWVDGVIHDGCFIEPWLGVEPDSVPNQGLYPEADDIAATVCPPPDRAVFIGRLETDAAVHIYIDTIRELRDAHDVTLKLDVYGDGAARQALEAQARADDLPVTFHGWQADAQERILDGCFAFVAGRMAMQEAMARRRIVVAAWASPLKKDYIRGEPFSEHVVSAGDSTTLAQQVVELIRDDAQRGRRVEAAYAYARRLSWRKTAQAYMDLWHAAPRRQARPRPWIQRVRFALELERERRAERSARRQVRQASASQANTSREVRVST